MNLRRFMCSLRTRRKQGFKPSTLRPHGEGETAYNQRQLPIRPDVRFGSCVDGALARTF